MEHENGCVSPWLDQPTCSQPCISEVNLAVLRYAALRVNNVKAKITFLLFDSIIIITFMY